MNPDAAPVVFAIVAMFAVFMVALLYGSVWWKLK